LYLTKADILRNFSCTPERDIPVVSAYLHGTTGEEIVAPAATADLKKIQVRTEMWPGFDEDISNVRELDKLPASLRSLLEHIEKETGATIVGVGTGPQRAAMAMRS
jgi:adenylosuccinate synthase